jgi:hypothetical protein
VALDSRPQSRHRGTSLAGLPAEVKVGQVVRFGAMLTLLCRTRWGRALLRHSLDRVLPPWPARWSADGMQFEERSPGYSLKARLLWRRQRGLGQV